MKIIEVSAPGSIMLCGEHAVLHGYTALACAIDKRITVKLTPRNDKTFIINSALGTYQSVIYNPKTDSRFLFIIEVVKVIKPTNGFELEIISEFSHQVGLGSSAAVTATVCSALSTFCNKKHSKEQIFNLALQSILNVQGRGSGSDLAASIFGGIISLQSTGVTDRLVNKIHCKLPPIDLQFCGYKMKTPAVIDHVNKTSKQFPQLYKSLYKLMGDTSKQLVSNFKANDWIKAGQLFDFYQGLMSSLGVSDKNLSEIINELRLQPEVFGAKISGSGLGDCVISLGKTRNTIISGTRIEVNIEQEGLVHHDY